MIVITGSVGRGGKNQLYDVKAVQQALNASSAIKDKLKVDGHYGKKTYEAILRYQLSAFRNPKLCDGLIEPHGRTLRSLNSTRVFTWDEVWMGILEHLKRMLGDHEAPQTSSTQGAKGSASKLTAADFQDAAKLLGGKVSVAMVRAIAEVESGGRSGFGNTGFPKIAFEGHIFQKLTDGAFDKSHPHLSYSFKAEGKAGPKWQKNNASDKTAVATLKQAMLLDQDAAQQSCSWGMFQVMGFNFSVCGYNNIDSFVDAMKSGERGQLEAFIGYCKATPGMVRALEDRNYKDCARLFNGPSFGHYDKRIRDAYERFSKKS